ncbi:positive regulation of sphingomyelin catabolic process [Sorochytrium milnesiophthora]
MSFIKSFFSLTEKFVIAAHRVLGSGSFGVVHLARWTYGSSLVAVKFEKRREDGTLTIFNEARIYSHMEDHRMANGIASSSVAPPMIHVDVSSPEWGMLVMPYAVGSVASIHKTRKLLPQKLVLNMAGKLLTELDRFRAANVVHADIKPDNILIDEKGHLRLTDLSLSSIGELHGVGGTEGYISVRAHAQKRIDSLDDSWSLGISLFDMSIQSGAFQALPRADVECAGKQLCIGLPCPLLDMIPENRRCLRTMVEEYFALWREAAAAEKGVFDTSRMMAKLHELAGGDLSQTEFAMSALVNTLKKTLQNDLNEFACLDVQSLPKLTWAMLPLQKPVPQLQSESIKVPPFGVDPRPVFPSLCADEVEALIAFPPGLGFTAGAQVAPAVKDEQSPASSVALDEDGGDSNKPSTASPMLESPRVSSDLPGIVGMPTDQLLMWNKIMSVVEQDAVLPAHEKLRVRMFLLKRFALEQLQASGRAAIRFSSTLSDATDSAPVSQDVELEDNEVVVDTEPQRDFLSHDDELYEQQGVPNGLPSASNDSDLNVVNSAPATSIDDAADSPWGVTLPIESSLCPVPDAPGTPHWLFNHVNRRPGPWSYLATAISRRLFHPLRPPGALLHLWRFSLSALSFVTHPPNPAYLTPSYL